MKILKIAFSNIRKRKSASITFFIMTLIAAFMLAISLTLFSSLSNFYDSKSDTLKGSHLTIISHQTLDDDEMFDYIKNYSETISAIKKEGYYSDITLNFEKSSLQGNALIFNINDFLDSEVNPVVLIDKLPVEPKNGIILPLGLKAQGVVSGDDITFTCYGKIYSYKIYAFFEDVEYGSSLNSLKKIFLNNEEYNKFESDILFSKNTYLSARFANHNKSSELSRLLTNEFDALSDMNVFITTYEGSKMSSTMFLNIISAILLLFSVILLLIAVIVVRFNIINSINDDMKSIGSLKSIGYTSKQIIMALVMQFTLIALTGSIIGMIFAVVSFGTIVGNSIVSTAGLLWTNSNNIIPMLGSIIIICLLVFGITFILARRTKKINPISALRQGETHHSFKHNNMPLIKYNLPLNIHLGLKRLFNNFKNNILITIVVSSLCLITSIVFVVKYNMIDYPKPFYDMVGLELSDVYITCTDEEYVNNIQEDYKENIEHVLVFSNAAIEVEGVSVSGYILDDFEYSTAKNVFKGRNPVLDNEIIIGTAISKSINKGIGDTVNVKISGVNCSYIVVGLAQGLSSGGMECSLTLNGIKRAQPNYVLSAMAIYLKDNISNQDFINSIKNKYGNHIIMTIDVSVQLDTIFSSLAGPVEVATYSMIIMTITVIAFVLFLLISSMIRQDKKNFGIMKSLGYTNGQLMLQILLSFIPSLFISSFVGVLISSLFANNLLTIVFGMAGIGKTLFEIPIFQIIILSLIILMASISIIYLVSLKIRKVSPQKLILDI